MNNCFSLGCLTPPSFTCECTVPNIFTCSEHLSVHIITPASHQPRAFLQPQTLPQQSPINASFIRLVEIDKSLTDFTKETIQSYSRYIKSLKLSMHELYSHIKAAKSAISKAKKSIISGSQINPENFSHLIPDLTLKRDTFKLNISKDLSKLFKTANQTSDEIVLFTYKTQSQELFSVSLNNFQRTRVLSSTKNWLYASTCKINENEYFMCGGLLSSKNQGSNVSIINIKDKLENQIQRKVIRAFHGCIHKDTSIFIFGGNNGLQDLDSAEKFDLGLQSWTLLPCIPKRSKVSTSIIEDKIIIAGRNLERVFVFHENSYQQNLVTPNNDSLACGKWVFTRAKLFECINLQAMTWNEYDLDIPKVFILSICATFRRDQHIYIMLETAELLRIDTNTKSFVQIPYS